MCTFVDDQNYLAPLCLGLDMEESSAPYEQQRPQHTKKVASGVQSGAFEFTKRKRWDEILLTELPVSLTLILSPTSHILFTGHNNALEDILGYSDDELLDTSLEEIMNPQDWELWQSVIQNALKVGVEGKFELFARFRRKSAENGGPVAPDQVLLEVRGHVELNPSTTAPSDALPFCIFAVGLPYPTESVGQLNGFLQSKIENETLQRRVQQLRELAASIGATSPPVPPPENANPSLQSLTAPQSVQRESGPNFVQGSSTSTRRMFPAEGQHSPPQTSVGPPPSSVDDGGSMQRRSRPLPQCVCVTCGRTDSPEWRKGPQGPKTLCNACGLRWAKKSKKPDDTLAPEADLDAE